MFAMQAPPAEPRRDGGLLASAARAFRYRLLIPLFRSPHPPEYTARGVATGVFWGLTPLVGIQSIIIGVQWIIGRRLRWEFSLIQGLAWTWVSNVFTMLPLYYLFYVTGMLLLGGHEDAIGYHAFLALWRKAAPGEVEQHLLAQIVGSMRVLGLPLFIGCLPWAPLGAWVSYAWSYRIVDRRRRRRRERERADLGAATRDISS
jgi:uncharacterized protein